MTNKILGYVSLYDMMFYFFIYAFLGWICEVIYTTLKTGEFVNRGFLNGPVCPIYGVGMALSILFLNLFSSSGWLLFLIGGALASILEIITGFILEKLFNTKWWDYSKEHFNFRGYVCLKFSIIWGLGILLLFRTVVPLLNELIWLIPTFIGYIILGVFWALLIIDIVTDVIQLVNLKKDISEINKIAHGLQFNTDKIGEKISKTTLSVKEKISKLTEKVSSSRIIKAFPKLQEINRKFFEKISSLKNKDKQ